MVSACFYLGTRLLYIFSLFSQFFKDFFKTLIVLSLFPDKNIKLYI